MSGRDSDSVRTSGGAGDSEAWRRLLDEIRGRGARQSRYRFDGSIARGGMGMIHRVFDTEMQRVLAMKVILDRAGAESGGTPELETPDERSLSRFLEEAQVTGQLDHPGIVPVHELGLDDEQRVYFTMKLVKGDDLRAVFDRVSDPDDPEWTRERALSTLLRVCEAMAFAHDKGVIHRDLKPANIMVGPYGETYVMDWGLAKVLESDAEEQPGRAARSDDAGRTLDSDPALRTLDGEVLGTPAYMPPEQAEGRLLEMGPRSDVYSAGAMLYHLLANRMPYTVPGQPTTPEQILACVLLGPPPSLLDVAADVPAELVAICDRAMAHAAGDRYPSMAALARDLRAYLENRVVAAYESGALAELRKWVTRNQGLSLTTGVALLIIALLTVGFVLSLQRSERDARESEGRAIAERRRADRKHAEMSRLSDAKTLADLRRGSRALWPAIPEKMAAMADWLEDAQELHRTLPAHRATLAQLRTAGRPLPHPRQAELDAQKENGAEPSRIRELEDQLERTRPYAFDDETLAWWHETLVPLVDGLEAFGGEDRFGETIAAVQARREFADRVTRFSIDYHATEWDEAILSIGDPESCPAYAGLEIEPQLGLAPIGRDKDSGLWEFWQLQTGERPERDEDHRLVIGDRTGLVFVLVPGGTFWLGSQGQSGAGPNYDPYHTVDESDSNGQPVELTLEPFFLSKYEMTQGQWVWFRGSNPSFWNPGDWPELGGLRLPVDHVSWEDCDTVLRNLDLVLPTEAQWEYACRGGTDTPWFHGRVEADIIHHGNVKDLAFSRGINQADPQTCEAFDDGHDGPAPAGSYAPNRFGLHELPGNLWEWCRDRFGSYDLPVAQRDGARSGTDLRRVLRGGSYNFKAESARSANRNMESQDNAGPLLGVRPARTVR